MRARLFRLNSLFRRFAGATRGVAAVEFALILPLLLTLYVGSVELSAAISVDKRVASVSGSLGDLVARADGTITSGEVSEYFTAAAATMAPYDSAGVKQLVSCVAIDAAGTAKVKWSQPYNGATKRAINSVYTLPADLKALATPGSIIVAESQLSYTPLFGYFFKNAFNLYHAFYFLPRFGDAIKLDATACA